MWETNQKYNNFRIAFASNILKYWSYGNIQERNLCGKMVLIGDSTALTLRGEGGNSMAFQLAANPDKFKALVHYICWRCGSDPSKLGAVKLNKALWIADLSAYYYLGKPITRSRYVKRKFGPTPKAILPVLRELENEGKIKVTEDQYYGKSKKTFISLLDAPSEFLSNEEKSIVERVVNFVCDQHTATSISEKSHDHVWKAAEDGEELPLSTVFVTPDAISDEDRSWAKEQLEKAEKGWRSVA